MKSDFSAESWLKFFTSSGIPMDSARTYAVTFSKNEIHLDMLSEIKKEYLVDMGITLMGHIIAILRHAKTVYEENITKTTLSSTAQKATPVVKAVVPKEKPVLKTMPLRITNEKIVASTVNAVNKSTTPATGETTSQRTTAGTSTVQNNPAMYGPHPKMTSQHTTEKESTLFSKKKDTELVSKTKLSSVITNNGQKKKPTTVETSSLRQNDVVSSSTSNRGKIFDRLGDEVTDSSSDSPASNSSSENVFSRLGGKPQSQSSPSTSSVKISFKSLDNSPESSDDSPPSIKRNVIQNKNKSKAEIMRFTMRADEAEAEAMLQRCGRKRSRSPSPTNDKVDVKTRLGRMSIPVLQSQQGRKRSLSEDEELIPPIGMGGFGGFRSDKIKGRPAQLNMDRTTNSRTSLQNKNAILRTTPVQSIGLSGLNKKRPSGSIKSRLGRAASVSKTANQKKVSFGPVSQQLIPLEMKPAYRQFRRMRFDEEIEDDEDEEIYSSEYDDYISSYNNVVNRSNLRHRLI